MNLTDKSQLIKYLKQNNLWAKKSLGQNFLIDKNVLDKIINAAELKSSDVVIEIGPGIGTLTSELVKHAGEVIAVEKDDKMADILNSKFLISNVKLNSKIQIIKEDALDINLETYNLQPNSYKLVANIPYYITSRILEKFLSAENKPELIVLLVQKEVAERICAKVGDTSVLSIAVQFYGEPEIVDIVPASSFFPAPKVDSAILKIKIKNKISNIKYIEKDLFKIVRAGFRSRRKTLVNNLMIGTQLSRNQLFDILDLVGLNRAVRAQELSLTEWLELSQLIQKSKIKNQN